MYDTIVNPPHWNEDMRTDALEPAKLDKPDLEVRGVSLETVGHSGTVVACPCRPCLTPV